MDTKDWIRMLIDKLEERERFVVKEKRAEAFLAIASVKIAVMDVLREMNNLE